LELAGAKAIDVARPYAIGIVTLVRGGDRPSDGGPASRQSDPAKPRLVELAQNQAPVTNMPATGQVVTAIANDSDRTALAIKLQQELKRVGCYSGSTSGDWDIPTRNAMGAFDDHIGARLSLTAPEPKFLTLVADYRNRACGALCPLGHLPDADGTCTVPAQFANADPTPPPEATADSQAVSPGPRTAPASQQTLAASPMSSRTADTEQWSLKDHH
jgi:hypothetical protein